MSDHFCLFPLFLLHQCYILVSPTCDYCFIQSFVYFLFGIWTLECVTIFLYHQGFWIFSHGMWRGLQIYMIGVLQAKQDFFDCIKGGYGIQSKLGIFMLFRRCSRLNRASKRLSRGLSSGALKGERATPSIVCSDCDYGWYRSSLSSFFEYLVYHTKNYFRLVFTTGVDESRA